MRYDLDFLSKFCHEIGLVARKADPSTLEVSVGDNTILCFQNAEREEDCLMGFSDTPWHAHGDLMFADPRGLYIELDPLNLLTGLRGGQVLLCELHKEGTLVDRWLMHSEYNDFKHVLPGERIIVRRADTTDTEV